MDFSKVAGFAEEKDKIEFDGFWDWLVAYQSVGDLWRVQPSYIYIQIVFLIGTLITFIHAVKNGGRFLQLWIGTILHGLVVETFAYNLPDVDNFWHAQTPITFLGRRLPLYIIGLYPNFIYSASVAVNKINLPRWSEPFAVGLITVLIDYPYDITGVKYLHWSWHDTDPNISDKHYHVPWNSFYFHSTFAASFTFWFQTTRYIAFRNNKKWSFNGSFIKEFMCTVIAALLGMPGGVLLFIPLYHPLHDVHKVHSSITLLLLFSIFLSLIWLGIPKNVKEDTNNTNNACDRLLLLFLSCYYIFYVVLNTFMDPANEASIGFHEPIGPCNVKVPMKTALGHTVYKRKYLCLSDNDETYFGWSCLPNRQPPKNGSFWYTICGTPYPNQVEYVVILTAAAIFAISFFHKTLGSCCKSRNIQDIQKKKKV